MSEKVVRVLAVAKDLAVIHTAWPPSNIICDVVHVVTHNKCTQ